MVSRAMGLSSQTTKSKQKSSFLGNLGQWLTEHRRTWRNLHLGHILFVGAFLITAITALYQAKPQTADAANHTLQINAAKTAGAANTYNVKIIDKTLYDTQPSGTDPNTLSTYGTYGGITNTLSGSNSLYTISTLQDLTTIQFRLVAPLSASADTTQKFYDWQGCSDIEDNYKADWTPGQDGIFETCAVTYTNEQTAYTRNITARYAVPNTIAILTSSTGLAIYQQQNVKVIDKDYYDTLTTGTDPNSLSTYGTYGNITSNSFYAPNGAYSYNISVPANKRFVSLIFPTFHPGSGSFLYDLPGNCIKEDNYKADWTLGQDGVAETCKIDFGDQYRLGAIDRTSGNYIEARYTKNTVRQAVITPNTTSINNLKIINQAYYNTLPNGTNPDTLSTYGNGGGIVATGPSTFSTYNYYQETFPIPYGTYTMKFIPSRLADPTSGTTFIGWSCDGSFNNDGNYRAYRCEDNYDANWNKTTNNGGTAIPDGIYETQVITINANTGGTNYNTDLLFAPQQLEVFSTTATPTDANYNNIDGVKFYSKTRYDTINPSAGVNPNVLLDPVYGTNGGVTNHNYNSTSYLLTGGWDYSVVGAIANSSILAPLTATNDPAFTFVEWKGCTSVQDNYDGAWAKTTNNGGAATPDGIFETCVTNWTDGLSHKVRAVYQGNDLTVVTNTFPTTDSNYLGVDNVRVFEPNQFVTNITGGGAANPYSYNVNSYPQVFLSGANQVTTALSSTGYYYTKNIANGTYKLSVSQYGPNDPNNTFKDWVGCDSTQDLLNFSGVNIGPNSNTGYGITPDGINETCVVTFTGAPKTVTARYNAQNTIKFAAQTAQPTDPKYLQIDSIRAFEPNQFVTYITGGGQANPYSYNVNSYPQAFLSGVNGVSSTIYSDGQGYEKPIPNGTYKLSVSNSPPNDPEYQFAGWVGCDSTQDLLNFYGVNVGPNSNTGYGITPDGINETCVVTYSGNQTKQVYARYDVATFKARSTTTSPTDINAQWIDNVRYFDPNQYITNITGGGQANPYSYNVNSYPTVFLTGLSGTTTDQRSNGYIYTKTIPNITGKISTSLNPPNDPGYSFVAWEGCDSTQDLLNFYGFNVGPNSNTGYAITPDGINETCVMTSGTGINREVVAKFRRTTLNIFTKTELTSDINYLALDNVRIRDNSGPWIGSYASSNDPNSGYYSCSNWNSNPVYGGGAFAGCTSTFDPINGYKYTRSAGSINTKLVAPYRATFDTEYTFTQWSGCDTVEDNYVNTGNWAAGADGSYETCVMNKADGNTYSITALYKRTTLRVYTTTNQPGAGDYNTIDNVKIRDNSGSFVGSYASSNDPNSGYYSCPNWNGNPVYGGGAFAGCSSTPDGVNGYYYERNDGVIIAQLTSPLRASNDTDYVFAGWVGCDSTSDLYKTDWSSGTDGIFETCAINFADGLSHTIRAQYRKADTRINVVSVTSNPIDTNYSLIDNVKIRDLSGLWIGSYAGSNDPNSSYYGCGSINSNPAVYAGGYYGGCTSTDSTPNGYSYLRSSLQVDLTGVIQRRLVAPLYATQDTTYTFDSWVGCASTEDNFDGSWNATTNYGGSATPDGVSETCYTYFDNAQINTVYAKYKAPTRLEVYTSTNLPTDPNYTTPGGIIIRDTTGPWIGSYGGSNDPNSAYYGCSNAYGTPVPYAGGAFGGCTLLLSGSYYYTRVSSSNNPYGVISTTLIAPLTATTNSAYKFQYWVGCTAVQDNYDASWTAGTDGKAESCVVNWNDSQLHQIRAVYTPTKIDVYTATNSISDPNYTQIDNVRIFDYNTYDTSYVSNNPNLLSCAQTNSGIGNCTTSPSANGYNYSYSNTTVSGRLIAPLTATNDPSFVFAGWIGCTTLQDNYNASWQKTTNNGGTAAPDGIFETCQFNYSDNTIHTLRAQYSSASLQVSTRTVLPADTNYALIDNVKVKDIGPGPGVPATFDPNSYTLLGDLGTYGGLTDQPNANGYYYSRFASTITTRLIAPLTATNDPSYKFVNWTGCDSTQNNYDASWAAGTDLYDETCVITVGSGVFKNIVANYRKDTTDITVITRTVSPSDANYALIDNVNIVSTDIYGSYSQRDPNFFSVGTGYGIYGNTTATSNPNGYQYIKNSSVLGPINTSLVAPLTLPNDPGYGFVSWTGCDSTQDNYTASWTTGTDGLAETCVFNHNDGLQYNLVAQYQKTTLNVYSSGVNTTDTNYYTIDGVVMTGTLGGTTATDAYPLGYAYQINQGVINGTIIAPVIATNDPDYAFDSWVGCTSAVGTTCTVNFADATAHLVRARYKYGLSKVQVYTSTASTNDSGYNTIDNVKIVSDDAFGVETPVSGQYTRTFVYNNPGSALSSPVLSTSFNSSILIGQGKMRSDCGDLRLFDTNGTTPINFVLENCNSGQTIVRFRPTTLAAGNSTYTVKYGNLSNTSVQNPSAIYDIYDLNTTTSTPSCSIIGAMTWDNTNKWLVSNNSPNISTCSYNTFAHNNFEAQWDFKTTNGNTYGASYIFGGDGISATGEINNGYLIQLENNNITLYSRATAGYNLLAQRGSGVPNINDGTFKKIKVTKSGYNLKVYLDGVEYFNYAFTTYTSTGNYSGFRNYTGGSGVVFTERNLQVINTDFVSADVAPTLGTATNDLTSTTTSPSCSLTNQASWDNTNKWLVLANPGTNVGSVCYNTTNTTNMRYSFDANISGTSDFWYYFGADNPTNGASNSRPANSYLFNIYNGTIRFGVRVNDSTYTEFANFPVPFTINDGAWRSYVIENTNNQVTVYINGIKYLVVDLGNYTPFGNYSGFRGFGQSGTSIQVRNHSYQSVTRSWNSTGLPTPFDPNLAGTLGYTYGSYGGITTNPTSNSGWYYTASQINTPLVTKLYAPIYATNDAGYKLSGWAGCDSSEDNYTAAWTAGQDGINETCVIYSNLTTRQVRAQYALATSQITVFSSTNNPLGGDYNTIDNVKFVSTDAFDVGATYNSGEYTQPIQVVNNIGTAQSNYQSELVLDTAALITAGQMRSDCGDIRVFSGATQLPYYVVGCNTANTSVWFKVSSLAAGTTNYTLKYGNLSNTSAESATATFDYADLLSSQSTPSCSLTGDAAWDNTNKYLDLTTLSGGSSGSCQHIYTAINGGYTAIYDFNTGGGTGGRASYHCGASAGTGGSNCIFFGSNEISNQYYYGTNGTGSGATPASGLSNSTWRTLRNSYSGGVGRITINGAPLVTYTYPGSPNIANTNYFLGGDNSSGTNYHKVRNYLIAKYSPLITTQKSKNVFNPNTANGTTLPYGTYGGTTSLTTTSTGWYYNTSFPSTGVVTRITAPVNATNDLTYALSAWVGCDSVEDNYTNAWTIGTDGVFETCVISQGNSTARTIRAQYTSNTTLINVHTRTLSSTDANYLGIDNVKIVSQDRYLSTALRDPNSFNSGLGYGDYGSTTTSTSSNGYFYTKNSFVVNASNTIATKLYAPLTATNDPSYIFDSWQGCDSVEDNYNASWNLGTDGVNETCVVAFSNGLTNNVYVRYKTTTLRVVTSTSSASNPEYLAVDNVKIVDKTYYDTLGAGTDPNSATSYGTLGGVTASLASDGYQYTYTAGAISGKLVAPLIATNDPTFKFYGWAGCTSVEDNYTATWIKTTNNGGTGTPDGIAETCVTTFSDGNVNTVRAIYQPPTRITVSAVRPTGTNATKVISTAAVTANGGIFEPGLAGTGAYTYGTEGGTTNYTYSSYSAITTNLYAEHVLSTKEVFTGWTGCSSTPLDLYKRDWTLGTDGIAETCPISYNNNQANTITANYRAPASLNVDVQKPLAGTGKIVSQDAFVLNGNAFDPGLVGTASYAYGNYGGTTAYTKTDGYIVTKLYPQLTLPTNEVFDSWTGCDSVENNYGATWGAVGADSVFETCVINLTNATPRSVRAIYKVTSLSVYTSTSSNLDPLYTSIDNVKIIDKSYYDTLASGTDPNTIATYGNLGGVSTVFSGNGYYYSKNFSTIVGRLISPLIATNDPTFDFRDWIGCDSVEDNYNVTWQKTTNNGGSATPDGIAETCVINFTDYTAHTIRARYGKTTLKVTTRTTSVSDPNYTLIDNAKILDKAQYDTQPSGTDPNTLTNYGTLGATTATSSSSGYFYNYKAFAISGRLLAPLIATNDTNYTFVSWAGCDSVEDNYTATWTAGTDGVSETCVFNHSDGIAYNVVAQYRNVYTNLLVVTKGFQPTDPLLFQIDSVKIVDKTYYDTLTSGTDINTLTTYGTWGDVTAIPQSGVGYFYSKQSTANGSITTKLIAPNQATNDINHFFKDWLGCDSVEDNYTITYQATTNNGGTATPDGIFETCVISFNNGLSNQITARYNFIAPPSTINVFTQTFSSTDLGYDNVQNIKIASSGYAGGDPSQYTLANLGNFGGVTTNYTTGQGFSYSKTQKPVTTRLFPSNVDPTNNFSFRAWSGCDSTLDLWNRNWVRNTNVDPAGSNPVGTAFPDNILETCVISYDDGNSHDITARYTATQVRVYSTTLFGTDVNYSNIDNVKIASQGYLGGDPNTLNVTQLGAYGNSTFQFGGPNPARWFYDFATGSVNTRLYAPLLATNDQTYIFTGWQGCNSTEDNYTATWTSGTDGVAETCVIDRNEQYNLTILATYSQTKIRVFANSYAYPSDPYLNNVQGVRVASQGYVGGNPLIVPTSSLGAFGGELLTNSGGTWPYAGWNYTVAATTINTQLYAPLKAPNNPLDLNDDYTFVEWVGCDSTQDRYDANWVLTTTYGGTANPDGLFETCVISHSNGLINDVSAKYSGNLVRINVYSTNTNSYYDPAINGVKILEIPYSGTAPTISDPNSYSPATLGTNGGVTSYQLNYTTATQIRLVAPFNATNNLDFQFDSWTTYWGGNPCSSVQDNYDKNFNLGSDGIFETCLLNISTASTTNIFARYKQTRLTVVSTTLSGLDVDFGNINDVKFLDVQNIGTVPTPPNPNLIASSPLSNFGSYGGITSTFVSNSWQYTRGINGYLNATLLAPLTATNDPGFDFVDWQGCDSIQDNYDALWNLGSDGRFETCIISKSNGSYNTVTARYSDHKTYVRVHASSEYCSGGCYVSADKGVVAVRDIGATGIPGTPHDPDAYNPTNIPGLGTFGDITVDRSGADDWYQKFQPGPGGQTNGTINTRLVAAWQSTTDPAWKFQKWIGCDSTQDIYDKDFNYGTTDGIFETCVFNRSNGQMNHIHAIYQFNTIEVHTSTPSGYDPDFGDIDNVKILEYGWGNPSLGTVVDPNTLTPAQLGKFGGVTSTQYYYNAYNNHDWYYTKGEGYIYQTRLLAPRYATNDPNYGFVQWQGCDSVEDNFNSFWLPGTDGIAETCVIQLTTPGNGRKVIRAVYDDARSVLTVASNQSPILITSPDPDFNNKNTNFNFQKTAISTSLRAPEKVVVTNTATAYTEKTFSSWSGCTTTQDLYDDNDNTGTNGKNETCNITIPDATNYTVTANYTITSYNYSWGAPTTDQPTLAKNSTGTTISSSTILENGGPLLQGTPCQNTLKYISPTVGALHTYNGTLNNLSKCITVIPTADIPSLGTVELSSIIPNWRGRTLLSSDFAPNSTRFLVDQIYTNTLYAYYDAKHPNYTLGSNTITDLSGRGNTGYTSGPAHNTSGVSSWVFNGTSDFMQSSLPSNYSTDNTFEVWYKRNNTNTGALVSQYRFNNTINRLALTNQGDKLSAKIDNTNYSQGDYISKDLWQMGTVTYNTTDNTIAVYANGVLQNTFNVGTLGAPSGNAIDIGRSVLTDYFSGEIAEVRIYNSALPEATIRANFEAQKADYGFTQANINISALPITIDFGVHPYTVTPQTGNNSLNNTTYLDRRTTSSAWNATISMTNFVNTTNPAFVVPASNFVVNNTPDARLMGSPLYVTYGASGNITGANIPKTLINVTQFNGSGQYQIDQAYTVNIPGYTPPGTYQSTITLTTTTY